MEESAPKRRRTSPRTSVNVNNPETTTPPSPASSRPRRKRPSFASPTKASIARHNPGVLERRQSSSPQKLPNARPSARRPSDAGSEQSLTDLLTAQIESSAAAPAPTSDAAGIASDNVGGDEVTSSPSRSTKRARGGMTAPARRSPMKVNPNPRPSAARAPETEESFNPFLGKRLRRSPPPGQLAPAPVLPEAEPQLNPFMGRRLRRSPPGGMPMAPEPEPTFAVAEPRSVPGPEAEIRREPQLRRSLRQSSPSQPTVPVQREPKPQSEPEQRPQEKAQNESRPESQAESEPEPEPEPETRPEPELPPSVPDPISSTPPKGIHVSPSRWKYKPKNDSPLKQPPLRLPQKPNAATTTQGDQPLGSHRTPAPVAEAHLVVRKTRPFDPDAEKKRKRDDLQAEARQLQKDLETAQKENERIRLMQQSGRTLAPSNQDEVVRLLRRQHGGSETETRPSATQQLVQAALNPGALLPFGKSLQPLSLGSDDVDTSNIKSHHPVLMTAEEELPYLELFSPFSMSSTISVLAPHPKHALRQLHSINLSSRETPGLFTARIDMIVDALKLTILNLAVTGLEPAAKAELGTFLDKLCTGDCNRSMERNVGIMSWAMGEWLRVATERAIFWSQLERDLGSKDAIAEVTGRVRARKSRRNHESEDEAESRRQESEKSIKKADLLRFAGQQCYDIAISSPEGKTAGSSVRLEWRIGFDWTGEAQSKLAVMIGVPGKWHHLDERGSLGKLPKLFEALVEGGEKPEAAVRTIVALVVGEGT